MAKHQHYDYKQSVIEPIFLEDQLMPGTLEHAIQYIVEERLNMSVFDARYNNDYLSITHKYDTLRPLTILR